MRTTSFVGSEDMTPFLVTVTTLHSFAKPRVSLNLFSS